MKKLYLLFIATFSLQIAFAQENYIDGYIINPKGETINGEIDFRDWANNPDEINFKRKGSNTPEVLAPNDILEFGVEDQIYESAIVEVELNSLLTQQLEVNPKVELRVDTAFLQVCVGGEKSLYRYKLPSRDNFYIKVGDQYERLIYRRNLIKGKQKTAIRENKKYIGQLKAYLNNNNTIDKKLRSTQYTVNSLMKVFEAYYGNSAIKTNFKKKGEKIITTFGVIAGITNTTLDFSGDAYTYLSLGDIDSPVNPIGGISLDFILPKHMQKWWLHNELLFSAYKAKGSHRHTVHEGRYSDYTFEIGTSHLKLVNMVRYSFPLNSFRPFISAGVASTFTLSETNYLKQVNTHELSVTIGEKDAIKETRSYDQGLVVGTGVTNEKLSFELRYELGNGMSDLVKVGSKTKCISLLLGYRF
ncbi:hypothetical protein EYV94_16200 [Puteibacter caeruleilacunae]|nr:hypothetical protein EYV94_16200 [Puteibacter caeruleilacunae]